MARLVDKFNVLIKSGVNSVLKDVTALGSSDTKSPKPGKDVSKDIARLREQIDSALDHEDRATADIAAMTRQIAEWDQQADAALQAGDDSTARQLVRQIQRAQQQRAMLEADLDQHRRSTSDLIRRVNEYEAVIAAANPKNTAESGPAPAADVNDTESLSERLRKARNAAAGEHNSAPPVQTETPLTSDEHLDEHLDEQAIEDDLARRRNRLSL